MSLASARCAAGLALAAALSACVGGPVQQHVRSGFERTRTGANEVQTQSNLVELSLQDRLGPDFEYRVVDKYVQSSTSLSTTTADTDDEATLHRPSIDVAMTSGPLRWSQLFQIQEDRVLSGSGQDNRLVRSDVLQKIEWFPLDLPQLTAWVDYRTVEDDLSIEERRVESRLQVHQAIDAFDYELTLRDERVDDLDADVESSRVEHTARLTYQERFLRDRLSTTVSVFATDRDSSSDVPTGSTPSVQIFPSQGLAAVDSTPQISTLPANLALIDGDDLTSAGVDIGGFAAGGQLDWNLGVELPPGSVVDVVLLKTSAVVPASFVSQFDFAVWASDDNAFWTLVESHAAFTYDATFQHFRLSIPSVAQRYLKVVNVASPAGAPSVEVAEIEVYRSVGSPQTSDALESATTNLSWRASETLTVGCDVYAQQARTDTGGSATRDETRLDTGVWAAWTPHEKVEANARASDQRIDDPLLRDEDVVTLIGVVSYHPLRTLDLDLSVTQIDREVDGADDVRTDVAQALASAELLPTLRAELSIEQNQLDDATNQRQIERWIGSAALIAEVTPHVEATVRARRDEASVGGPGAAQLPDPSEDRYELTLVYRPSEQLIAESELEWIDNFAGSGLDQRLRLDWIPFPGGALDMQLDFDRTRTESFADTQTDRYRALLRYSFNPSTYLELQYAAEDRTQAPTTEIVSLAFNFSS